MIRMCFCKSHIPLGRIILYARGKKKLRQELLEYKQALELKETRRASEKRRAMEDAIRERKRQERNPRLPDLVTTCRHSCFDIL